MRIEAKEQNCIMKLVFSRKINGIARRNQLGVKQLGEIQKTTIIRWNKEYREQKVVNRKHKTQLNIKKNRYDHEINKFPGFAYLQLSTVR